MDRERQSVKSIFDEAAEIASPEERAAYLERACGGDADVRKMVEALLLALDKAGSFLEASPDIDAPGAADASSPRAEPGASPEATSAGSGSAVADTAGATASVTLPPLVEGLPDIHPPAGWKPQCQGCQPPALRRMAGAMASMDTGQRDVPKAFVRRRCRSRVTNDGSRMLGVRLPRA